MTRLKFIPARSKPVHLLARNPIFKALGRNPMTQAQQTDLALAARIAFDLTQQGKATEADRDTLACVANVVMVLAEKHCSPDDLANALAAQEALLRADGRALQGKRWNFDAKGRQAMITVLDAHEQQIAQLGQAAVTEAVLEVQQRRARGQVHQVVLAGSPP